MNNTFLKEYENKILTDLGLSEISEEEKQKVLHKFTEHVNKSIMAAVIKVLNEDQRGRFVKALEEGEEGESKIAEIAAEVPGLDKIMEAAAASEMEIFKSAMAA